MNCYLVTLAQIRVNLIAIRDNVKKLESLLQVLEAGPPSPTKDAKVTENNKRSSIGSTFSNMSVSNAKFRDVMRQFHGVASGTYEKLDARFKKAESQYEKAVLLYGEDSRTMTPDEFFGIFWNFCVSFNAAKDENEAAIQKEEELKKREADRKVIPLRIC